MVTRAKLQVSTTVSPLARPNKDCVSRAVTDDPYSSTAVPFERLNKSDAVLLVLDLQDGLYGLARDFDATVYYNAMIAHAALGKLFDLPVILSTSAQTGPNGPLPKEILDMYPDAPLVERQGEVDAWDNDAFRQAVRETGRKQIIVAGIVTDVCKHAHLAPHETQRSMHDRS